MSNFHPDPKPCYSLRDYEKKVQKQQDKTNAMRSHNFFYKSVWQTRRHFCIECGTPLKVFHKSLVHHIIEKRFQPRYSINLDNTDNGCLLCIPCHSQAHTDLSRMNYTKSATIEMQKKYEQYRIK